MTLWQPARAALWQGRNDLAEADNALRVFQTIQHRTAFVPDADGIALLGFACDEGVKRNHGRPGAQKGPDALRSALANMASHRGHDRMVDLGNIHAQPDALEAAQDALSDAVKQCQQAGMRTLVFGGGHETAFGHGRGVLDAWPDARIAIINIDAHLDLRRAAQATSGTPFRQLALHCEQQGREFNYTCIGVNPAANTEALLDEAARLNVNIIWDTDCQRPEQTAAATQITALLAWADKIYLTIDLDALPGWQMPAVSAPAGLGIPLDTLLTRLEPLCRSPKLQAVDLVEFNPEFDHDSLGAKVAARLAWQIVHQWSGADNHG
ncbi:formimidoylglutamase [Atlantibacter sp.]|uniref:formimidoylglutamase n=1 Tax=Atlantibacter sp. TaxID=1903473 RepID=UPI0028A84D5C|nr:formimidoylglutamase [Atlantibacter sp.]